MSENNLQQLLDSAIKMLVKINDNQCRAQEPGHLCVAGKRSSGRRNEPPQLHRPKVVTVAMVKGLCFLRKLRLEG
mgnify:CR=1 FL=1